MDVVLRALSNLTYPRTLERHFIIRSPKVDVAL